MTKKHKIENPIGKRSIERIIGQEIFAQNRGFIIGKAVKIMISEG